MRFWVELKDHVPNGQTVTSLLRFNTFNTKQTYNKSMSGSKGVAAVTTGDQVLIATGRFGQRSYQIDTNTMPQCPLF